MIEVSINGERVALLPLNTRMSETDQSNGLDLTTPPIHVKAGPQRVSAAFIQNIEGPIDDLLTPLENTLADVSISFGDHDAAAHAGLPRGRADQGDRRVRDAEPRQDLHLPPDVGRRGRVVRAVDRQAADRPGVPWRPVGRGPAGRDEVLRPGPRARRIRGRRAHGAAVDPDEPAVPVPHRGDAERGAGDGLPRGRHRRRPRGCRSSCGARRRMPSCCARPAPARSAPSRASTSR